MDVYTESAFVVAIIAIMIELGDVARRVIRIQRDLRDWRKEWQASKNANDATSDKEN